MVFRHRKKLITLLSAIFFLSVCWLNRWLVPVYKCDKMKPRKKNSFEFCYSYIVDVLFFICGLWFICHAHVFIHNQLIFNAMISFGVCVCECERQLEDESMSGSEISKITQRRISCILKRKKWTWGKKQHRVTPLTLLKLVNRVEQKRWPGKMAFRCVWSLPASNRMASLMRCQYCNLLKWKSLFEKACSERCREWTRNA